LPDPGSDDQVTLQSTGRASAQVGQIQDKISPKVGEEFHSEITPTSWDASACRVRIMKTMTSAIARLRTLALSDTGFLFDPTTGHTYTLNRTGTDLLKWLRDGIAETSLSARLAAAYDVTEDAAERDCALFLSALREYRLLES
jgi:PqqD family protein of HPr-rel-A system